MSAHEVAFNIGTGHVVCSWLDQSWPIGRRKRANYPDESLALATSLRTGEDS